MSTTIKTDSIINELIRKWRECGIKQGDTILLHSDVKHLLMHYNYYNQSSVLKKEKVLSVDNILDSFFGAVGSMGTLIIPLFNFDFSSKNQLFDIRNTPSQMGVLTECARSRKDYVRTKNPVYSFAIFGKNKQYFESIELTSALGKDSVFSRLIELNGKIAVLGLPDKSCMTFYHHIEEMHAVSYRVRKKFTAPYKDWDGSVKMQTINLFVRDLSKGVSTLLDPVADLMWKEGLYIGEKFDQGLGLRTISANKMYRFVSDLILINKAKGFLYSINK